MTTTNDVTGDRIKSKGNTKEYKDNWDRIFGKKDKDEDDKLTKDKE